MALKARPLPSGAGGATAVGAAEAVNVEVMTAEDAAATVEGAEDVMIARATTGRATTGRATTARRAPTVPVMTGRATTGPDMAGRAMTALVTTGRVTTALVTTVLTTVPGVQNRTTNASSANSAASTNASNAKRPAPPRRRAPPSRRATERLPTAGRAGRIDIVSGGGFPPHVL